MKSKRVDKNSFDSLFFNGFLQHQTFHCIFRVFSKDAWESHNCRMKAVWESHENRIDVVRVSHKCHMPLT